MSDPKKYQIRTIADIYNTVPADKIELCMAEIAKGMALAAHNCELMRSLFPEVADKPNHELMKWPESMEWIDDDKGEFGFDCVDESGTVIFGMKSKPEAQG